MNCFALPSCKIIGDVRKAVSKSVLVKPISNCNQHSALPLPFNFFLINKNKNGKHGANLLGWNWFIFNSSAFSTLLAYFLWLHYAFPGWYLSSCIMVFTNWDFFVLSQVHKLMILLPLLTSLNICFSLLTHNYRYTKT